MGKITERQFADPLNAAAALAEDFAAGLRAGIEARGLASAALSGGRSPVPFLHALAALPLRWDKVCLTLVDERWVDPAGPNSNEALLRHHLLGGLAAAARFEGLKTTQPEPALAVAERSAALAALPQPFDAILLGMGEDGHTASLFPGTPGLAAALDPRGSARLVAIPAPASGFARLSFTLAALLDARQLYLQIQGPAKRRVYERARTGADPALPISLLLNNGRVPVSVYLVD